MKATEHDSAARGVALGEQDQKRPTVRRLMTMAVFGLLASLLATVTADAGYVVTQDRSWGDPVSGAVVDVCWSSDTPTTDARVDPLYTDAVRDAAGSWSAAGNIRFVGWDNCSAAEMAEHKAIYDSASQPNSSGSAAPLIERIIIKWFFDPGFRSSSTNGRTVIIKPGDNAVTTSSTMNLRYPEPAPATACTDHAPEPLDCWKRMVVHEFAHAVGITHENTRHDSTCLLQGVNTSSDPRYVTVGDYDVHSITNVCRVAQPGEQVVGNTLANQWNLKLSPGDVASIRHLYGLPQSMPMCSGLEATIVTAGGITFGTAGDDVIVGVAGSDTIHSFGGNDIICAGGGDDIVRAGNGDDRIYGQSGDDTIYAGNGDDIVRGQAGHDTLYGQSGDDRIWGSVGNDVGHGGPGNDVIKGDAGNDRLQGSAGVDRLYGGDGNDRVDGGSAGDFVTGGQGNDIVLGSDGDDRVVGNNGDDRLLGGDGADELDGGNGRDNCNGGAGTNTTSRCEVLS